MKLIEPFGHEFRFPLCPPLSLAAVAACLYPPSGGVPGLFQALAAAGVSGLPVVILLALPTSDVVCYTCLLVHCLFLPWRDISTRAGVAPGSVAAT